MDIIKELEQREKKKLNIVIFGMDESTSEEEVTGQSNKVLSILELSNIPVIASKPGKKTEGKKRILLMKCQNESDKQLIFKNVRKLKNSSLKHISITHDLTKNQQEQRKKLYEELKRKREAGENVVIRNGKITTSD